MRAHMKERLSKNLNFRIAPGTRTALERLAKDKGMTLGAAARSLIDYAMRGGTP
jgi:hypothetical protein